MIVYGLYLNNEWDGRAGIYTDRVVAERQAKLNRTSEKEYKVREMDIILNSPSNKLAKIKGDIQGNIAIVLDILKYRINKATQGEESYSELRKLWFYLLPDKFVTHEALVLARKLGVSRRTTFRWLAQSWTAERPTLWKVKTGRYEKLEEIGSEVAKMVSYLCIMLSNPQKLKEVPV